MIEVVIIEDDNDKNYSLHKNLLCEKSLYFKRCIKSGMLETTNNKVVLRDVNFEAFEVVVYWLYKENLDKISENRLPFYWVYNLADRLCMEPLKNKIVDRLGLVWAEIRITTAAFKTAMADLHVESTLAAFLIDQLAYDYVEGFTDGHGELHDLEHDVLVAFMNAWAAASKARSRLGRQEWLASDPAKKVTCIYHQHIDTLKCHHSAATERFTAPEKHLEPRRHVLKTGENMPVISDEAWDMFRMMENREEAHKAQGFAVLRLWLR